ncbi:MAG: leucine-rich repeat protein [Corallococcus sp.]|nr:leucine-rich repeat protein [Corallococcus sp.]
MKKRSILKTMAIVALAAIMCFSTVCTAFAQSVSTDVKAAESSMSSAAFDPYKVVKDLQADFSSEINKDLIKRIDDYELKGQVNVIITFSDDSLVSAYNAKSDKNGSLSEYLASREAKNFVNKATARQNSIVAKLKSAGLVSFAKYNYSTIMDGVYVSTTYENIEAICKFDGVKRVIVSNTYKPQIAVENPVNVYDTGIFNSGDVEYTGKGTIVAVLDTGCDYTHTAFTSHKVVNPLYDRNDIARILPATLAANYSNGLEAREVYYGNITNNKIAYGYDYADKDPDVMPFASEHGTHVAAIIAGSDDTVTGVAVDAQLAIMKVFSDYREGADDGDIMAALEDSVALGVDAINMSLGTSCGFTREYDNDYKNQIYSNIEKAGISLIAAASNDYSSAYGSEEGNTNKTSNPDSSTVGAPSTYNAALSVASINGNKDKYMLANGAHEVFFLEAYNQNAKEYNFFEMLGVRAGETVTFDYVTVPGYGSSITYTGLDVEGKIALVKRGDISFEDKVRYAYEAGAAAIIIYNNVFGDIVMTVGNDVKIPVVSIGKDDGEVLAELPNGTLEFNLSNVAGPFMSDFSSWGPTPDLKLKPEITAHGGNILSAVPGGGYDKLSGTSMAAPNMCGITVLIRQFVKESYPNLSPTEVRDLVNQLCMSTATIALDKKGNPYSPRKQGAGIADIKKATTTKAYLYVDGSGKTKLELGDDPSRLGVYTMSVNLKNLSDRAVSYKVGSIAMTETLSSSDPEYVAERAYLLSDSTEYSVENATLKRGVVTVAAGQTAKITATVTLSKQDKAYLNANFENGMYVEGFLTFENTEQDGVDLNAPFLAFYGDWSDAPIFDKDYYLIETEAHNNAIDDDDKIKPDYYATTPLGMFNYDYVIPLGSYLYEMDESQYRAIPAVEEHASVSYYKDCISGIYAVFTGLLRGAKTIDIQIVDTATGEVKWQKTDYNAYKAHYSGVQYPYISSFDLDMVDLKESTLFGDNNTHYKVTMTASLDWDGGKRNISDTYSFSFYIDYESPIVTNAEFYKEYDRNEKKDRYYVDLTVYDNHYAMSLRPVVVYQYTKEDGTLGRTTASLSNYAIPIYQNNRGEETVVNLEITDYIDLIAKSALPEGLVIYIDDYSLNSNIAYIPFPEAENGNLVFKEPTLSLDIGDTFDLTTFMKNTNSQAEVTPDYLRNLTWSTTSATTVAVSGGQIEALKQGSATVSVKGSSWLGPVQIRVDVSDRISENNGGSGMNANVNYLELTSYDTLFAFNDDIDRSEIGKTGTTSYFDGKAEINFYPSEKVKLNYLLKPWNLDPSRIAVAWTSSNKNVATVDENGVVTAQAEGRCRVTLRITVDGKTSYTRSCTFNVKSEFIIENRELVAYKGWGGDVVIPDDEGIMYIGSFAFCHYNLDHEKEVEGDRYDIDLKKEPIGNNTVTSVTIPDGIEEIRKYAFYNSKLLKKVTLGKDCTKIYQYAFYNNTLLQEINLDDVKVISDYAFYNCENLGHTDNGLAYINVKKLNVTGDYTFAKCSSLTVLELLDLRRSGKGAFSDCSSLSTVVLGENANLNENAFENSRLYEITLHSATVPDYAFKNCTQLRSVTLTGDLTYLGKEAFNGCTKLGEVVFQGGCEYIGSSAFYGCTQLETMVLPVGEIEMGDLVFGKSGIKNLIFTPITFIVNAGIAIFNNTSSLKLNVAGSDYYQSYDNTVLLSKDGKELLFALPTATLGNYTLPASVERIHAGAFAANTSLLSFRTAAGSQLKEIGEGAFAWCVNLTTVNLPQSVTRVDEYAFYEANRLSSINLDSVTYVGSFAFYKTAVRNVSLAADGVTVDARGFYGANSLQSVTLGANATLEVYAFLETPVRAVVMPQDGGVTVKDGAFMNCRQLSQIDLSKAAGKLGKQAFYNCIRLTSVDLSNITEIGDACFADCTGILTVNNTGKLVKIGESAFFFTKAQNSTAGGGQFTSIDLSNVEFIGEDAFYFCKNLTSVNLDKANHLGIGAFAFCLSLKDVSLGSQINRLDDAVFYECESLDVGTLRLDNIVYVGDSAFYGAKLPQTLTLPSVTYVGSTSFTEPSKHGLVAINLPSVTEIAPQAFANCTLLTTVNVPKLEKIGFAAFMDTAVQEFEVTDNLKKAEYGAFNEAPQLKALYAMQNGQKKYTATLQNSMVDNGVLYVKAENGSYVLVCYPVAKTDKDYSVAEGTVRIEYIAAYNNKSLTNLTLPMTLEYIGNMAFYGCDKLDTVTFKSYYAPVLEGTTTMNIEITPDNKYAYPKFDLLYKYDFYMKEADIVAFPLSYNTFIDTVTSAKTLNLKYIYPDESQGYDSTLYKAYFNDVTDGGNRVTSGETMGRYAIAFIKAVQNLPAQASRYDESVMGEAVGAYNALMAHRVELKYVDQKLIDEYLEAYKLYNADAVVYKIERMFDMDCSEYSYNKVRDAYNEYEQLSDEEKALVTNYNRLTEKMAQLSAEMGNTLDFDKEFSEYAFPTLSTVAVVFICIGAAAVVGGAAAVAVILIRKKRGAK